MEKLIKDKEMLKLNLNSEQAKKQSNISFIGLGNMGEAIARAISFQNKEYNADISIGLFDKDNSKLKKTESILSAEGSKTTCYKNIAELTKNSAIIFICVKPQTLPLIYEELRNNKTTETYFISIAAGVPLYTLSNNITSNNIARFMPNIAAKARKAVTAVATFKGCTEAHENNALEIAKSFGTAFKLDENKFSAFIGISGSAIAYIYEFAHALAMGGTREGIPYNESVEIAFNTMESAKALFDIDKENPISLASKVCSAGGTTIEGMKSLSENNFDNAVMSAVSAASQKSKDLEKN